ncbi:MAG: hypothetical protein ACJ77K_19325 [Bacteroidia bacterium]
MNTNQELIDKIKLLGYTVRQIGYRDQAQADKNEYNYRYWIIPEENSLLKDTPFYHDSENDFIHFTSLEALYGILNSKHLRLYNLLNMDDKYELGYAKKSLSFLSSDKESEDKEGLYAMSFCSSLVVLNEEPKKKKHLLWKLHGRDGHGVIIRFKIYNDLSTWYNFYLAKCFYDLDNFYAIKELNEVTDKEILDAKLGCFIKLPIYEFENEIRLVFDKRHSGWIDDKNGKRVYPLIYPDKLNTSDKIYYFQLPLYNFFKDNPDAYPTPPNGMQRPHEIPKIGITEIILGYRYNEADLLNLRTRMELIDPTIVIKLSDLRQFYS